MKGISILFFFLFFFSSLTHAEISELEIDQLKEELTEFESVTARQASQIKDLYNQVRHLEAQNKELVELIKRGRMEAVIPAPILKPFADNRDWVLVEDLIYTIGKTGINIRVPKGFVTDFASIPQILWSFGLSPHGRYSKAAIVHDFLYWGQMCTKKQADNILLIAMKESDVGFAKETEIFQGVNLGGAAAWNANKASRLQGIPRVIPEEFKDIPGHVTWAEYRSFLMSEAVKDPEFDAGINYCKYGNSRVVPDA